MPLQTPIDLELFSQPLAPDAPAGVNIREDQAGAAVWSTIRDLRDEARRIERRADDGTEDASWRSAVPIWVKVREQTLGLLRDKTHDLSVAAVLIEALLRTDGFAGASAGFDVARVLVESQWDSLFPAPDPDDGPADEKMVAQERLLPLARLVGLDADGLLLAAILNAPLTDGHAGEPVGLGHYRISRTLEGLKAEALENAIAARAIPPELYRKLVQESQRDFLTSVYSDLRRASAAWQALSEAISTASAAKAELPVGPIVELFAECQEVLETCAPVAVATIKQQNLAGAPAAVAIASEAALPAGTAPSGPPPLDSMLTSRDDAIRSLERVADYFFHSDPHSLIALQIRNIVRLAGLPCDQYYKELIGDETVLTAVGKFVGLTFDEPT